VILPSGSQVSETDQDTNRECRYELIGVEQRRLREFGRKASKLRAQIRGRRDRSIGEAEGFGTRWHAHK
jgi:hypothetical protein